MGHISRYMDQPLGHASCITAQPWGHPLCARELSYWGIHQAILLSYWGIPPGARQSQPLAHPSRCAVQLLGNISRYTDQICGHPFCIRPLNHWSIPNEIQIIHWGNPPGARWLSLLGIPACVTGLMYDGIPHAIGISHCGHRSCAAWLSHWGIPQAIHLIHGGITAGAGQLGLAIMASLPCYTG